MFIEYTLSKKNVTVNLKNISWFKDYRGGILFKDAITHIDILVYTESLDDSKTIATALFESLDESVQFIKLHDEGLKEQTVFINKQHIMCAWLTGECYNEYCIELTNQDSFITVVDNIDILIPDHITLDIEGTHYVINKNIITKVEDNLKGVQAVYLLNNLVLKGSLVAEIDTLDRLLKQ